MMLNTVHVLMCHPYIILVEISMSIAHFTSKFFVYLLLSLRVFRYSAYKSCFRYFICKYFLLGCSLFSPSLIVSLGEEKFLILKLSNLSIISFMDHNFDVTSKKSLSNSNLWRYSPMLYSKSFRDLQFTFRLWSTLS